MTSKALDYPAELAEEAYAHCLVPNKAAKEKATFDEHMEEVRKSLSEVAKSEPQRELLNHLMAIYRRGYVVRLSDVLRLRIENPPHTGEPGDLGEAGRAEQAMRMWARKEQRNMKADIINVEQPDGRWTQRASKLHLAGGRSA